MRSFRVPSSCSQPAGRSCPKAARIIRTRLSARQRSLHTVGADPRVRPPGADRPVGLPCHMVVGLSHLPARCCSLHTVRAVPACPPDPLTRPADGHMVVGADPRVRPPPHLSHRRGGFETRPLLPLIDRIPHSTATRSKGSLYSRKTHNAPRACLQGAARPSKRASLDGPVAQSGQSIGLLIRVSWVRIPAGPLEKARTYHLVRPRPSSHNLKMVLAAVYVGTTTTWWPYPHVGVAAQLLKTPIPVC